MKFHVKLACPRRVDLLQVSLLIYKQTGGMKKKKTEGKGGGERDLWTTRSENEALIHQLKFDWLFRQHERKPPVKILTGLVFGTRSPQVSLSSSYLFRILLLPSCLFIDQERDLQQVHPQSCCTYMDTLPLSKLSASEEWQLNDESVWDDK